MMPSSQKVKTIRRRRSRMINTQRHRASCGPIAVANAIKWSGIETSYRDVLRFCRIVRAYHPKVGMYPYQMTYVLRTLQMRFKARRSLSIADLDRALDSGRSLILVYETERNGSHAAFVDARADGRYRVWNRARRSTPWCSRETLSASLDRSHTKLYVYIFQALKSTKKSVQAKRPKV